MTTNANTLPERSIALSKSKTALLLLCAMIFVVIGAWMMGMAKATWFHNGLGAISVIFFGACGLIAIKKLLQTGPGLVVNAQGLVDQSSGVSVGFVPWRDVSAVQPSFVSGQKFVSLILHDAAKYTSRGNALQQRLAQMNIKMVGTPINMSANTLKINFDELLYLLHSYHQQSQKDTSHG